MRIEETHTFRYVHNLLELLSHGIDALVQFFVGVGLAKIASSVTL